MPEYVESTSRRVAVGATLASAAFFAWWGLSTAASWPASAPFFAGVVVAWIVAAVGVHRDRAWGPGFASGLAVLSVLTMLPVGLRAPISLFLGGQVVLLTALAVRGFAAPGGPARWRHTGLAFAAGLGAPWLLVVGLLPGLSCGASLLGLAGFGLAAAGVTAAFRGKTWGLLAMLGAIPLLLAVPPAGFGCHAMPHDRAGELASVALGLAVVPWATPLARALFGRRA